MKLFPCFKSNVILEDTNTFFSKTVITSNTLISARQVGPHFSSKLQGATAVCLSQAFVFLWFNAKSSSCFTVYSCSRWSDFAGLELQGVLGLLPGFQQLVMDRCAVSEYFKAAQVNSSDSTYKSTGRLLKANNLNCKAKNLKCQMVYLTCYSVRAHTKKISDSLC